MNEQFTGGAMPAADWLSAFNQAKQQQQEPSGFMGLLSSPVGQGLLGAGFGALASRGTTSQAIGRGGLLGLSVFGQAQEQQRNRVMEEAQRIMAQQQLQEHQNAFASIKPRDGGGFDMDVQALLRTGAMKPTDLSHVEGLGRPQIQEYQNVRNPDGSVTRTGFTKDGKTINTGAQPFSDYKPMDFGGSQGALDPVSGAVYDLGRKTPTYADQTAASNAQTNAARLGWDMSKPSDANKPPPGYRWRADGGLEAIPGGPADEKATLAGRKEEMRNQGAITQADRMIASVDEATKQLDNWFTTGISGATAAKIPGSSASDLRATLQTIKSNLGFAELQAMREASPTGGALGSVAVQELQALQSTVANLDTSQSEDQIRRNLAKIRQHYGNVRDLMTGKMPKGYDGNGHSWGNIAQEYEKQGMPREVVRQVLSSQGQDPAAWGY
ncbi:MAG: hypothetical protein LBV14_13525 [Acidovorax sp.]|jgi:hypothetical protein|nr:hypothetical protein [Acidovorax sp.]